MADAMADMICSAEYQRSFMERIDKILNHDLFVEHMQKNEAAEAERSFCRHNMGHLLDVARIAMILNLEEALNIPKDVLYAAALLHDIGRHIQYEDGTPHEQASAEIAPFILRDCGYDEKETCVIINAIRLHRSAETAKNHDLNGILYRADKASRACFSCKAIKACDWKQDKKNYTIRY